MAWPPTFQALQRRQALPQVRRGATGMDFGRGQPPTFPLPPAPPHDGTRPDRGQDRQSGGAAIDFCNAGVWRACQKPGDYPICNLVTPRGTKQNPTTPNFQFPRVVPFFPRIWSFLPRVTFCRFAAPGLSISLFSLRREREERGCTGKFQSPGCPRVKNCNPRNSYKNDSKPGG